MRLAVRPRAPPVAASRVIKGRSRTLVQATNISRVLLVRVTIPERWRRRMASAQRAIRGSVGAETSYSPRRRYKLLGMTAAKWLAHPTPDRRHTVDPPLGTASDHDEKDDREQGEQGDESKKKPQERRHAFRQYPFCRGLRRRDPARAVTMTDGSRVGEMAVRAPVRARVSL
jgi:hypothetical protein